MLSLQDIQFHPAWHDDRATNWDLVREFGMMAFSPSQLAALGQAYLDFSSGSVDDWALWRGIECLEAAAERGSEVAQDLLDWIAGAV